MNDGVLVAVGPRQAGHTAAVLDPVTTTVREAARSATGAGGHAQLTACTSRWDRRRGAVEGCGAAGRPLAQRLVAGGELVRDVPAKLAARVRGYSRGQGRKTGKHDAVPAGLAARPGPGIRPVAGDDATVSRRLRGGRRAELIAQRTPAVGRLPRLLAEPAPGGMRREPTANQAPAPLARIRPAGDVAVARGHLARDHRAGRRALDARLNYLSGPIAALVTAPGTGLTGPCGTGPVIAGRVLAEAGGVARFPAKDAVASDHGTAPVGAPPGDQVRHRLSRAGHRRTGHARHTTAVTQIRCPATPGRLYYQRKRREGKTPKEALRCLKRRLSDLVHHQLLADRRGTIEACRSPTTPRPARPASTSPAPRSSRPHHPSGRHTAGHERVRRAGLERPPPRQHRDPRTPAPAATPTSPTRPKFSAETAPS